MGVASWRLHGRRNPAHASLQRQGASNEMMERAAVLLGTAQFRLKVKIAVPEGATLADVEDTVRSTIVDDPIRTWTLVDDLGIGYPVQLALRDFIDIDLQGVETTDEQPVVLWEKDD
jgi:hypothetical protein